MSRVIILIGGMPTAGKSTIATAIANQLGIPWFSTDQIRTIMEGCVRRSDYPLLFNAEGHSAESFLTTYTPEEIADMEYRQSEEVWPAIKNFIEKDWVWSRGFVLEGINIVPELVARDYQDGPRVRSVFLSDMSDERIRHVVHTRGLFGPPDQTPDHLKQVEVEWTRLFDARVRSAALVNNMTVVEVNKNQDDISQVLDALSL